MRYRGVDFIVVHPVGVSEIVGDIESCGGFFVRCVIEGDVVKGRGRDVHGKVDRDAEIFISEISHSTDNALMIAAAGYLNFLKNGPTTEEIKAEGNLAL